MSGHTLFPIVQDTTKYCDQCQEFTTHRRVTYPDSMRTTCSRCGSHVEDKLKQKQTPSRYPREELRDISNDLNSLAGEFQNHPWGNMGKKDQTFLGKVRRALFGTKKKVDDLASREE